MAYRPLVVKSSSSGAGWRPHWLRAVSGRSCQAIDLVILGGVLLSFEARDLPGQGLGSPLHSSVSLRNLLIAAMCLGTWYVILTTVGVYRPSRMRSLSEYVFRCIIGLNSCAVVVGLIEIVLHSSANAWRMVELFWICSLMLTALARLLMALLYQRSNGSRLE